MKATRILYDMNGNVVNNKSYYFLLEDTENTNNINMHTYDADFCVSYEEALGQMYIERPEFKERKIKSYTVRNFHTNEIEYEWESEEIKRGREVMEKIMQEQKDIEF